MKLQSLCECLYQNLITASILTLTIHLTQGGLSEGPRLGTAKNCRIEWSVFKRNQSKFCNIAAIFSPLF